MKLTFTLLVRFSHIHRTSLRSLISEDIEKFSQKHPSSLSLHHYINFGTKLKCIKKSKKFLCQELPVRFANIMKEFYLLPEQLLAMPSTRLVQDWYEQSFHELLQFSEMKIHTLKDLNRFNEKVEMLKNRHMMVVETMAQGILELKSVNAQLIEAIVDLEDRSFSASEKLSMLYPNTKCDDIIFGTDIDQNFNDNKNRDVEIDGNNKNNFDSKNNHEHIVYNEDIQMFNDNVTTPNITNYNNTKNSINDTFSSVNNIKVKNNNNNKDNNNNNYNINNIISHPLGSRQKEMNDEQIKIEEFDKHEQNNPGVNKRIQYFLDRFYTSRIGINTLLCQHLGLFSSKKKMPDNFVGEINLNCDILDIAEEAYHCAKFLCEQNYDTAPSCQFICKKTDDRIKIAYFPSHLYHMLFELLKNALRAVVEHHKDANNFPDIKVLICQGKQDVTIKISDQGGGIARNQVKRLFNYMYTTAQRPDSNTRSPMAGFGYGLPLSRVFAKYMDGDLFLHSIDGYGTDAVVSIRMNPNDCREVLPIFNKTTCLKYTQATQIADWSDSTS